MTRKRTRIARAARRGRAGFTLMEILAALAVMSVATFIMASLFASSMTLARSSRNIKVASALAEEQLAELLRNPGGYVADLGTAEVGQFVPVRVKGEAPNTVRTLPPPTTKPTVDSAFIRERNFHEKFSWEAYAKRIDESSHYAELTVVVRWIEAGRDRSVTLTSAVPRSVLEGAA